jgi:hypothetical protein
MIMLLKTELLNSTIAVQVPFVEEIFGKRLTVPDAAGSLPIQPFLGIPVAS